MAPESYPSSWIICRKSRFPRKNINIAEYCIYGFITQNTVATIFYPIVLSRKMKSKPKLIVNIFAIRNIFSPGKLELISVSNRLRRGDNRMKCRLFYRMFQWMKSLSNLSFFYRELLLIRNLEPLTSPIYLPVFGKFLLKWSRLHDPKNLGLDVVFFYFQNSKIDDTLRDGTSFDNNLYPIGECRHTRSSIYEFFDWNRCKNIIFFHIL